MVQLRASAASCLLDKPFATPIARFAGKHQHLTQRDLGPPRHATLHSCHIRRFKSSVHPGRSCIQAATSGAAAFNVPSQQEVRRKAANRIKSPVPKPAQLPPPPKSTSLFDVLPYLTKLAVSDAQLYWRLGLAFLLMVASKAAGKTNRRALLGTECLMAKAICVAPLLAGLAVHLGVQLL